MVGGIGCFISSAITVFVRPFLVLISQRLILDQIFFPRSISQESGYGVREKPPLDSIRTASMSALPPHQYDPSKTGIDIAGYESSVGIRHTHSRPVARPRSVCSCSIESVNHYISTSYETGSESSYVRPQSSVSYAVTKTRSVPSRNAMSRNAASRTDVSYSALRPIERRHSDGANFDAYSNPIHATRVIGGVLTPEPDWRASQMQHVGFLRRPTYLPC